MNRVMRGTVVFAAALGVLSCAGDPTSGLRDGIDHLTATPGAIFIRPDSSKNVVVTAVDKQGNALGTAFSLGAVGAGITVVPDDSFNLVYDTQGNLVPPTNWTRIRYIVSGVANSSNSSFVVTAGGKSLTIPVRLIPDTTSTLTVSTTTPALGDTVTATAGVNFRFTPTSIVSLPGATVVTLGISADSTQIFFIPGPSGSGPITVTNMVVAYAPALSGFTGNSGAAVVTTAAVADFPATFSTSTPSATFPTQDTVVMTAGAGFIFLPGATVSVGGVPVFITAADSLGASISFVPIPGSASGPVTVSGVALSFLTTVPLTIPTQGSITVAASNTGTDALATAPTINIPATGATTLYIDAGAFATGPAICSNALGGPCRIYKFVLAGAATFDVSASWQGTTDIGIYFTTNGTSPTGTTGCDSKGATATGQPETCTATFASAGTYYLVVDSFAPFYSAPNNVDPTNFSITLIGQ